MAQGLLIMGGEFGIYSNKHLCNEKILDEITNQKSTMITMFHPLLLNLNVKMNLGRL